MKTKTNTRKSCYCLILVSIILLIGCTRVVIVDRNITVEKIVYNNTIEYINNTIIEPCNVTEPEINTTIYDRDYVLSLIRQLKHYEKVQDRFVNQSSCMNDLNRTEYKLELREEELCEWNSSWC